MSSVPFNGCHTDFNPIYDATSCAIVKQTEGKAGRSPVQSSPDRKKRDQSLTEPPVQSRPVVPSGTAVGEYTRRSGRGRM
jgi:hypothetical protein